MTWVPRVCYNCQFEQSSDRGLKLLMPSRSKQKLAGRITMQLLSFSFINLSEFFITTSRAFSTQCRVFRISLHHHTDWDCSRRDLYLQDLEVKGSVDSLKNGDCSDGAWTVLCSTYSFIEQLSRIFRLFSAVHVPLRVIALLTFSRRERSAARWSISASSAISALCSTIACATKLYVL